jgi:amino acid permease
MDPGEDQQPQAFCYRDDHGVVFEGTSLLINNAVSERPFLLHRDSDFSVDSDYDVDVGGEKDYKYLNAWQGAALLTADCLGTGLLALPHDIEILGKLLGLGFLVLNLPINYYAGVIFHKTATYVENRQAIENRVYAQSRQESADSYTREVDPSIGGRNRGYEAINQSTVNSTDTNFTFDTAILTHHTQIHHDTATFDFIGMTTSLFKKKSAARWVMAVYYVNIFLVLGNYILVMSHAVAAVIGENRISILMAGLVASVGMVFVSMTRTMAQLGRSASIVSLTALLIVILQCLWEIYHPKQSAAIETDAAGKEFSETHWMHVLRQLSALGSIGFAVGSQKLFLNIRHELEDRSDAPFSLGVALTVFGTGYVILCLMAGPHPPSFLFDAIPKGTWNRQVAGFLLWVHVIVSYGINSQAICSSMDRLVWRKVAEWMPLANLSQWMEGALPRQRWIILTLVLAATAYLVANCIPFFKDLVALIGSATSVPLTLLLPALFWRKRQHVPLFFPTCNTLSSMALTYFALAFMVLATTGSLYSIFKDWADT